MTISISQEHHIKANGAFLYKYTPERELNFQGYKKVLSCCHQNTGGKKWISIMLVNNYYGSDNFM